MHVLDALERFVTQIAADGRSPHTVAQYRRQVGKFAAWLTAAGMPAEIESIDHEVVAAFLASKAARTRPDGKDKKPSSTNVLRTSLCLFFQFAQRAGYVDLDATRLVRRARCAPPPPRGLSDIEEARLLAAAKAATGVEAERDLAILELMLATGVRVSSALAMRLEDLDLSEGVALVRQAKGQRPYQVWLGARAKEKLAVYVADRTEGPVFPARHGEHVHSRQLQRRFAALREQAGLPVAVTLHSLRHRFAMSLYQKTGDVLLVRDALAHKCLQSTLVYARSSPGRLREALAD